jgi:uncharacterized membrane protein YhdT
MSYLKQYGFLWLILGLLAVAVISIPFIAKLLPASDIFGMSMFLLLLTAGYLIYLIVASVILRTQDNLESSRMHFLVACLLLPVMLVSSIIAQAIAAGLR